MLFACTLLSGCLPGPEPPLHVCVAGIRDAAYVFSFRSHKGFWQSVKLVTAPQQGPATELEVWRLQNGQRRLLWSVEHGWHGRAAETITYGEPPELWEQQYPQKGPPEPLEVGGEYELTCGHGVGRFKVLPDHVENSDP